MTPTEDLLAGTLAEEAAAITRESLRPLAAPDNSQLRDPGLRYFGERRLRPVAALASALSMLLVIGVIVAARSLFAAPTPFANVGTAASPPPYYVVIDPNENIIVQATVTGRRTDVARPPDADTVGTSSDAALAVSADGRTYVAAFNNWRSLRTELFRFTVTSAGKIADFSMIRTERLPGLTEPSLAISAHGGQLALAGIPDKSSSVMPSSGPPRLLVVNLRTGRVRTWHGLAGTGAADSIEDPAWTTSGSLRFLVARCHPDRAFPYNGTCQGPSTEGLGLPTGTEWTLNVPRSAARLGPGRVLVRLPGATVQAQSGRGGGSVTALQLLPSGIRVVRYDVATGRLPQVLYRHAGRSDMFYSGLAIDGSGKYLLVNEKLGTVFGWLRGGKFHKLPVHAPFGNNEVIAAAW